RTLLAHGGDALVDVRPRHVEELERERRVERRPREPQPVVQRELRVPDRLLGSLGEAHRDLERALLELGAGDAQRYEADPLRLGAVEGLAEKEVVLRLREAAQERP